MTLVTPEQIPPNAAEPCLKCDRLGFPKPVEKLPDGGVKWQMLHEDGKICHWTQYADVSGILPKSKKAKKKYNPKYVICPICGDEGLVNAYPKSKKNKGAITYRIIHNDKKRGQYPSGKDRPTYHMIKTQEHRDNLLKQINLYISPSQKDTIRSNGPVQTTLVTEKRGVGRPSKPEPEEIEEGIDEKFRNLIKNEISTHRKKKANLIDQYGKALEKEAKIPLEAICEHIANKLKGLVTSRYVREILPERYKNKEQKRRSELGGTSSAHTETITEYQEPEAVYQMDPAEYRSEDLEQYDKPFLCDIIRYLEKKFGI